MLKKLLRRIRNNLPVRRKTYDEMVEWYVRLFDTMGGDLARARQQGTLSISAMRMVYTERDNAKAALEEQKKLTLKVIGQRNEALD